MIHPWRNANLHSGLYRGGIYSQFMSATLPNAVRYWMTRDDLSFGIACQRLFVPFMAVVSAASAIAFVPPDRELMDRILASFCVMNFLSILGLSFLLVRYWTVRSELPREVIVEPGLIKVWSDRKCFTISAGECRFWRGSPAKELTGLFIREPDCWLIEGPFGIYCLPDSLSASPASASDFLAWGILQRPPMPLRNVIYGAGVGLFFGGMVSMSVGCMMQSIDPRPQVMFSTVIYGIVFGLLLGIIDCTGDVFFFRNLGMARIGSLFLLEIALATGICRTMRLAAWEGVGLVALAWCATGIILLRLRSRGMV